MSISESTLFAQKMDRKDYSFNVTESGMIDSGSKPPKETTGSL